MAANLARIKEGLGISPVTLVAVTKNVGIDRIAEAFQFGITEFGENRVQDALDKQQHVPPHMADKIHWHLIGHLQTNKVKKIIGKFDLIHSVDTFHLAEEISNESVKRSMQQSILLQVKIVEDPTKSGFDPAEIRRDFGKLLALPGLKIEGLMTIAPLTDNVDLQRSSFIGLRSLKDELENTHGIQLKELSMGMTQDWQEAVKCGATMVRLGRAIFEVESEASPRPS